MKRSDVEDALLIRWKVSHPLEIIETSDAYNRILGEDTYAQFDIPVVRASAMDGVGVKSAMFENGLADTSSWVLGSDFIRADTGDDFDDAFDTVIAIESVSLTDGKLKINEDVSVQAGMNVRRAGSSFQKGDLLAKKYTRLTPSDQSALISGGVNEIKVVRKPKVAFIPTGSELVSAGTIPGRGQVVDSNSILVKGMLEEMGAEALIGSIVKDDYALLEEALDQALLRADIVILNGGSSKGDEDFNARLLKQKGEVICHGVAAAPGKPMCVAMLGNIPVVNVPGPPLAAFYGTNWLIRRLVTEWLSQPLGQSQTIMVRLTEDINVSSSMEILCKMEIHKTQDGYEGRQAPFRNSTMIENLIAPGIYITELGIGSRKAGEEVAVTLIRNLSEI
jgi:molybdopterin molybdotransferase/putative molybdopterin biosynthesis protein